MLTSRMYRTGSYRSQLPSRGSGLASGRESVDTKEPTSLSSGAFSSDGGCHIYITSRHLRHWPQLYVTSSSSHIAMMIHFTTSSASSSLLHSNSLLLQQFLFGLNTFKKGTVLTANCEATIACTRLQQGTDTHDIHIYMPWPTCKIVDIFTE